MKKWQTLSELKFQSKELIVGEVRNILLKNRGITTKKEVSEFLNPRLENVTIDSVGIDKKQLQKALKRIQKAIKNQEQIIVFGDYDVDGICGSAILWETLRDLGANALPYIPHRIDEGYGLSSKGIDNIHSQFPKVQLIITVDNGIVAQSAVEYANEKGIDVIITDHHVPSVTLPKAHAIVHTTILCGTGVAYLLSQELRAQGEARNAQGALRDVRKEDNHLELVALATVADVVPLVGANRTLLTFGLEKLKKTTRVGLLALLSEAGLQAEDIDVYRIGHIICPRLNAAGRLDYAMDSLRLLCTKDKKRAAVLAEKLGSTNRQRQLLTEETVMHAITGIRNSELGIRKLLFVAHETYQPGVIGLVAGKLVEEFYRPSIVLSIGNEYSKASARSISGFNIIDFVRTAEGDLVNAGGHPMAAGFTVETVKLASLQKRFEDLADEMLDDDKLTRNLRIDCELPFPCIDTSLHNAIQKLSPFGMGNPEPTFVSKDVVIEDMKLIGKDRKHLKLKLKAENGESRAIDGIAFGFGERAAEYKIGDAVQVAYTINEDTWNGNSKLQLKIKDIKI